MVRDSINNLDVLAGKNGIDIFKYTASTTSRKQSTSSLSSSISNQLDYHRKFDFRDINYTVYKSNSNNMNDRIDDDIDDTNNIDDDNVIDGVDNDDNGNELNNSSNIDRVISYDQPEEHTNSSTITKKNRHHSSEFGVHRYIEPLISSSLPLSVSFSQPIIHPIIEEESISIQTSQEPSTTTSQQHHHNDRNSQQHQHKHHNNHYSNQQYLKRPATANDAIRSNRKPLLSSSLSQLHLDDDYHERMLNRTRRKEKHRREIENSKKLLGKTEDRDYGLPDGKIINNLLMLFLFELR